MAVVDVEPLLEGRVSASRRSSARPRLVLVLAVGVAILLALPLIFLLLEAHSVGLAGQDGLGRLVFRHLTAQLLWNTVRLVVVVTAASAVIGTLAAWCVERTDIPGRRYWAVLVVLPVGIPDFVVSFGWVAVAPAVRGFLGAVLIMTLATYPLVYLPVAAALRSSDPAQEEVARSLGVGRVATFLRVTLGQVRLAVLGGAVLVALALLAEYGAFEILGYRTFTTEIFTEFGIGATAVACALSLILVVLGFVVLAVEFVGRGRGRVVRTGALAARPPVRWRLGRSTLPTLAAMVLLVGLALGVPVGSIVYLLLRHGNDTLPQASILSAALHTAGYSAAAGVLATALALPVALLSVRWEGRIYQLLERSTYLVMAVPGLVIALALTFFVEHYLGGTGYESAALLVLAYAMLFFPLALVAVRTSLAQAPVALEDIGRSLGCSRLAVLGRVTLPLVAPGLAAAFSLVFLSALTELTATLVLIPSGVETLSTQFWAYQTDFAYGQAAPYAALMIAIAAVPSFVLGRWFDRLPARRGVRA